MAPHRVYLPAPWPAAQAEVAINGDEARHAMRVKRVRIGEPLQLLDGQGRVGEAVVTSLEPGKRDETLRARLTAVTTIPRPDPSIELWTATPKGDEAGTMIDQLSQLGVTRWRPLASARSVVHPGDHKLDRFRRIALEASKQSGRTWLMELGEAFTFAQACARPLPDGTARILADAPGLALGSYEQPVPKEITSATSIIVLVGPEGGWTDEELTQAQTAGLLTACFGRHTMRIETAAVAAASILTALTTR